MDVKVDSFASEAGAIDATGESISCGRVLHQERVGTCGGLERLRECRGSHQDEIHVTVVKSFMRVDVPLV